MTKWEYSRKFVGYSETSQYQEDIERRLNEAGDEEWELDTMMGAWGIFKRPALDVAPFITTHANPCEHSEPCDCAELSETEAEGCVC